MSFWDKIEAGIAEARRRTLGTLLDKLAAQKQRRNEAAFSIALIALSAKMAKADGIVTDDEIDACASRAVAACPAPRPSLGWRARAARARSLC